MEEATFEDTGESMAVLAAKLGETWVEARAMGLFLWRGDRLFLEVSDHLEQTSLDYVASLWLAPPQGFVHGAAHFHSGLSSGRASITVPCMVGTRVRGLLYLETRQARRLSGAVLHALGRILSAAVASDTAEDMIEWTGMSDEEADAANLRVLMARHEWNLSRVARELGVTRMTVYNRLRRHQIPREKVSRSRPRTRRRSG